MLNNLLDAIADVIKDGQQSEKKGLYYLAGLEYSQARGMLESIVFIHDSNSIRLTEKEEYRVSVLFGLLATCFQSLQGKVGNGKHRMSGASGTSKGSLREALDEFLSS